MPQQYQEESVFNMALAYLKRIDKLLYLCQQAATQENMGEWIKYLRGVYREASVKLNDYEKKEIVGDYTEKINLKTLTDSIITPEEANFKNIYYLINDPRLKIKNKSTILFLIDALEIKIRGKLQKKGMLLPSKDDPRMAITQR